MSDITEQGPMISALVKACEELVSTINATGGLEISGAIGHAPCGDPEWADLADAALAADHALELYYAAGNPPIFQAHEQERLQIQTNE